MAAQFVLTGEFTMGAPMELSVVAGRDERSLRRRIFPNDRQRTPGVRRRDPQ
jgi:hypothetical protein